MTEREIIKQLKKEIGDLKLELARVRHLLALETKSSTKHIGEIYRRIKMLDDIEVEDFKKLAAHIMNFHDMVEPIEQKLFPKAKATRQQLAAIIGTRRVGAGAKFDTKKKP